MEAIRVERQRGPGHDHARPAGEEERDRRSDVDRARPRLRRRRRGSGRSRADPHRRRRQLLRGSRSLGQPVGEGPHRAARCSRSSRRCAWWATSSCGCSACPKPTLAKVDGVAVGVESRPRAGVRPRRWPAIAPASRRSSRSAGSRSTAATRGCCPAAIGLHKAKELAFFADMIDAKEAESMGLVNRVVPAGELDALAEEWGRRLAAGPTLALGLSKRLLDASSSVTLEQALEDEARCQHITLHERGRARRHRRLPRAPRAALPRVLNRTAISSRPSTKLPRRRCSGASGSASARSGRRCEQLLEQHRELEPRQLGPEAVVAPVASERDVLVRLAPDVERHRVREHALVAVADG